MLKAVGGIMKTKSVSFTPRLQSFPRSYFLPIRSGHFLTPPRQKPYRNKPLTKGGYAFLREFTRPTRSEAPRAA